MVEAPDVAAQIAEVAGEPDLVLEADLLVAEEDHLKAREGVVQFGDLLLAQGPREIDAGDLRADVRTWRAWR